MGFNSGFKGLSEMTGDHFRVSVNTGDITGCFETKEFSLLYQPANISYQTKLKPYFIFPRYFDYSH